MMSQIYLIKVELHWVKLLEYKVKDNSYKVN